MVVRDSRPARPVSIVADVIAIVIFIVIGWVDFVEMRRLMKFLEAAAFALLFSVDERLLNEEFAAGSVDDNVVLMWDGNLDI